MLTKQSTTKTNYINKVKSSKNTDIDNAEYYSTVLDDLDKLKDKNSVVYNASCVRQKSNWTKASPAYKFDSPQFNPDQLLDDVENHAFSPKLLALIKKIHDLDRNDQKVHGKKFKHFIFSDIKTSLYGPKLISAALIAYGFNLAYTAPLLKKGTNTTYGALELIPDETLKKTRGKNFFLLSSVPVYDRPITVKAKKAILGKFNERPSNVHGDLARFIVMDSGYKEGIDLFDIKYIHIFEPSVNAADQKQVIGRGTRTCGQKGLDFDPKRGWPLHVFVYDLEIPDRLQPYFLDSKTGMDLYLKSLNINLQLLKFSYELERESIYGSVDYELNKNIHSFAIEDDNASSSKEKVDGGAPKVLVKKTRIKENFIGRNFIYINGKAYNKSCNNRTTMAQPLPFALYDYEKVGFDEMRGYITDNYQKYKWDTVTMENLCIDPNDVKKESEKKDSDKKDSDKESEKKKKMEGGAPSILKYSPSQDFVRHYFSPLSPVKGLLLWHSVGTGKTCSAIAAATANFEPAGYTILWVTRNTLKSDIWKNMFGQVCNEAIRQTLSAGEEIPEDPKKQMELLSYAWRIRPISYKQFSNLVSKKNDYYDRLVKENGSEDPLRKTLIIIDEAHKLYGGGDLSSIERPDMGALHESLMRSYAVSGEDSVRLLLMTATPITESPMELVQLVNLCKPLDQQIPAVFDRFSDEYLNESGEFTREGRAKYLDAIAGNISYLNREKDARQFAQPVIEHILVPIATDKQIDMFDKAIVKSEIAGSLKEIEDGLKEKQTEMEKRVKTVTKQQLDKLKDTCAKYDVPIKKCETVANTYIRRLSREIADYMASIKSQIRVIKAEIAAQKEQQTKGLRSIRANIKADKYENYKNSAYFKIKDTCSSSIKSNSELKQFLNNHPTIQHFDEEIKSYSEHIEQLKTRLQVDADGYKAVLREMRQLLKDPKIPSVEKKMARVAIEDHKTKYKVSHKILESEVKNDIAQNKGTIKKYESSKKKQFLKIRTTLKNMERIKKAQLKRSAKEQERLNKTLKKQEGLDHEISDQKIKELFVGCERELDRELAELEKESRVLHQENQKKLEQKIQEKERKDKSKTYKKVLTELKKKTRSRR